MGFGRISVKVQGLCFSCEWAVLLLPGCWKMDDLGWRCNLALDPGVERVCGFARIFATNKGITTFIVMGVLLLVWFATRVLLHSHCDWKDDLGWRYSLMLWTMGRRVICGVSLVISLQQPKVL